MVTIYKNIDVSVDTDVEVEVSLSDFAIDDIIEMLEEESYVVVSQAGYDKESYEQALEKLCYMYRAGDRSFMREVGIFLSNLSGRVL